MRTTIEMPEDRIETILAEYMTQPLLGGLKGPVEVKLIYRQAKDGEPRSIVAIIEYDEED